MSEDLKEQRVLTVKQSKSIPNPIFKIAQPWRCLCLGSVQITRTTLLRRMTLQFLHILLTDARTFMTSSPQLTYISSPSVALEIRFLHQAFVLVRHQMRLHLGHEIHHYNDNDQQ